MLDIVETRQCLVSTILSPGDNPVISTISTPNFQLLIKGHRYNCNPFEVFA